MAINGYGPIRSKPSNGIGGWSLFAVILLTIVVCSGVSWILTSTLAAPKSEYAADINTINNTIGHLQDAATSLDSFLNYQSSSTQTKIDDVENDILGINANLVAVDGKITGLNSAVNTTNGKISTLTATVGGIGSLQIVPTITTTERTLTDGNKVIDGGSINLAIRSNQTVDSRVVAFKVEFIPNEQIGPLAETLDQALQELYSLIPIELKPGGSSGVAVAPDHVSYGVYYGLGGYYLRSIEFSTHGTAITKDTTAKTLAYVFSAAVFGYSFNVTITPIFEAASTTMNTIAPTW